MVTLDFKVALILCLVLIGCLSTDHYTQDMHRAFGGSVPEESARLIELTNTKFIVHPFPWKARRHYPVALPEFRVWKAAYFDPLGDEILGLHPDRISGRDHLRLFSADGIEIDHLALATMSCVGAAMQRRVVLLVVAVEDKLEVIRLDGLRGKPRLVARLPLVLDHGSLPQGRIAWVGTQALIAVGGKLFVVDIEKGAVADLDLIVTNVAIAGEWTYLLLPGGEVARTSRTDGWRFVVERPFPSLRFDQQLFASVNGRYLLGRRLPTLKDRWASLLAMTPPIGPLIVFDTTTLAETEVAIEIPGHTLVLTAPRTRKPTGG